MECGLDSIFFLTDNLGKLFEGQYVLASYVLYSDLAQQLSHETSSTLPFL